MKVLVFVALIAAARAGILAPSLGYSSVPIPAPVPVPVPVANPPAHYDFGYSVSDPITGDIKDQQESRRGDLVQGRYSLVEPDGTRRVVEYTADDLHGFNAVVRKEPLVHHVPTLKAAPVPVVAPILAQSPVLTRTVVPSHTFAAPIAKYSTGFAYPNAHIFH